MEIVHHAATLCARFPREGRRERRGWRVRRTDAGEARPSGHWPAPRGAPASPAPLPHSRRAAQVLRRENAPQGIIACFRCSRMRTGADSAWWRRRDGRGLAARQRHGPTCARAVPPPASHARACARTDRRLSFVSWLHDSGAPHRLRPCRATGDTGGGGGEEPPLDIDDLARRLSAEANRMRSESESEGDSDGDGARAARREAEARGREADALAQARRRHPPPCSPAEAPCEAISNFR